MSYWTSKKHTPEFKHKFVKGTAQMKSRPFLHKQKLPKFGSKRFNSFFAISLFLENDPDKIKLLFENVEKRANCEHFDNKFLYLCFRDFKTCDAINTANTGHEIDLNNKPCKEVPISGVTKITDMKNVISSKCNHLNAEKYEHFRQNFKDNEILDKPIINELNWDVSRDCTKIADTYNDAIEFRQTKLGVTNPSRNPDPWCDLQQVSVPKEMLLFMILLGIY